VRKQQVVELAVMVTVMVMVTVVAVVVVVLLRMTRMRRCVLSTHSKRTLVNVTL